MTMAEPDPIREAKLQQKLVELGLAGPPPVCPFCNVALNDTKHRAFNDLMLWDHMTKYHKRGLNHLHCELKYSAKEILASISAEHLRLAKEADREVCEDDSDSSIDSGEEDTLEKNSGKSCNSPEKLKKKAEATKVNSSTVNEENDRIGVDSEIETHHQDTQKNTPRDKFSISPGRLALALSSNEKVGNEVSPEKSPRKRCRKGEKPIRLTLPPSELNSISPDEQTTSTTVSQSSSSSNSGKSKSGSRSPVRSPADRREKWPRRSTNSSRSPRRYGRTAGSKSPYRYEKRRDSRECREKDRNNVSRRPRSRSRGSLPKFVGQVSSTEGRRRSDRRN